MSQAEQAQKGFKTFILTLSISLIVFSAIYYMLTSASLDSSTPDIESNDKVTQTSPGQGAATFEKLANQKITDVQPRVVLAASDAMEPTQSTGTPNGGVTSITLGLIMSVAMFMFGSYVIANDPRKMALKIFEKKISDDL